MILSILILIIAFILLIIAVIQFFNIIFRGYAPLFSTNKVFIKKILEEIDKNQNYNIYELGCGFAKFLIMAEKTLPNSKYVGIEYSFLPYMLTKIKLKLIKSKIKIVCENFLKTNLQDAHIIYCYLIPDVMEKLSQKLKNECSNTLIVSYRFSIPNIKLDKTINFGNNKFYFYKI
ncbi:MAG: hypothetical protein PHH83_03530 [Patescibacteria group bacterium]|nr:hypothetical protein [Patescibacteria group bacterium]